MSIAEQVQIIRRGLFTDGYEPSEMRQILDNGTQTVVHWARVRPAIVAIGEMPWYDLNQQWQFFLDEGRYPVGRPMDLRPDEVDTFQNLIQNLVSGTRASMQTLMSVHAEEISPVDISVAIDTTDLETLEQAIHHVRRTAELAAVGDAVSVSSIQAGSMEVFLAAGEATRLALNLAILLAKALKNPQLQDDIRRLVRLRRREADDVDEEAVRATVMEDTQETFWETATEPLERVARQNNLSVPEATNKINQAAREIHDNAERVSADWRFPPAVISGLPSGLTVAIYDANVIGQVIKELAAPPDDADAN